jgi:hypothetical protein
MTSAEELRAEARRLREIVNKTGDPALKQKLAAQALALAERAEAMARAQEDPEIVRVNIERYRHMIAAGIEDKSQRRTVEQMLHDAEMMLKRIASG